MNLANSPLQGAEWAELLGDAALTVQQLANGCAATPEWVVTHVQAGVLLPASGDGHAATSPSEWRFASATLVRARRVAHLEQVYDADPQLAALATDLMEEVAQLRSQLRLALGAG